VKEIIIIILKKISILFYNIHDGIDRVLRKFDPFVSTKLTSDQKALVVESGVLKNKHSNVKRCFILACGPSVNKQDLKNLEGELCISVSNFFVHPDFKQINPSYHVFARGEPDMKKEDLAKWYNDCEEHSHTQTQMIVSIEDQESVVKYKGFKKNKVHFYYNQNILPSQMGYCFDFTRPIPYVMTVSNLAIYLAIYLGIKEIYLLGFDHDMILNLGKTRHFYEEKDSELDRLGYLEWINGFDLETVGGYYKNMWAIYKDINRYALQNGIKISNITPNSLLDVFPRDSFEAVLSKK
jgi:hypothetical protein